MSLYKVTISPTSNFASPLKGDMLFGQICWAIRYKYGEHKLEELLKDYDEKPFLIVSNGFAKDYLPKPTMPNIYLNEDRSLKKENKKKIWLSFEELQDGQYTKAKTDEELSDKKDKEKQIDINTVNIRNSVNYKTSNTQGDSFSPYGEEEFFLLDKDIYFYLDERFALDEFMECLNFVSKLGYGKNTTIGKGRFDIGKPSKLDIKNSSKTFMTLSAINAQNLECKDFFYEPFTKFGKHGAELVNKNPFKKPILLADAAAVINFDKEVCKTYIGKSIRNISSHEKTVHQGYSIVIPIKDIEDDKQTL